MSAHSTFLSRSIRLISVHAQVAVLGAIPVAPLRLARPGLVTLLACWAPRAQDVGNCGTISSLSEALSLARICRYK